MNYIGLFTFIRREMERTFRVAIQTLVTPWISAVLYIFIFGYIIGGRIELIAGVPYIDFVLPGILMMSVIASAFAHSSSSVYFLRFLRNIDEILVAPFSYFEIVLGHIIGAVSRAMIIAIGILIIAVLFGAANIEHLGFFFFYTLSVAIIFALLGIIEGLWANNFEQLSILTTFVITPLSFLGGVFYSVTMLSETFKPLAYFNPFFYFIDGARFAMIGIRESNEFIGYVLIISLVVSLFALVVYLYKIGWRIRT